MFIELIFVKFVTFNAWHLIHTIIDVKLYAKQKEKKQCYNLCTFLG